MANYKMQLGAQKIYLAPVTYDKDTQAVTDGMGRHIAYVMEPTKGFIIAAALDKYLRPLKKYKNQSKHWRN